VALVVEVVVLVVERKQVVLEQLIKDMLVVLVGNTLLVEVVVLVEQVKLLILVVLDMIMVEMVEMV
jgi:hypothetical protein